VPLWRPGSLSVRFVAAVRRSGQSSRGQLRGVEGVAPPPEPRSGLQSEAASSPARVADEAPDVPRRRADDYSAPNWILLFDSAACVTILRS
jgi:hypothetical protein